MQDCASCIALPYIPLNSFLQTLPSVTSISLEKWERKFERNPFQFPKSSKGCCETIDERYSPEEFYNNVLKKKTWLHAGRSALNLEGITLNSFRLMLIELLKVSSYEQVPNTFQTPLSSFFFYEQPHMQVTLSSFRAYPDEGKYLTQLLAAFGDMKLTMPSSLLAADVCHLPS